MLPYGAPRTFLSDNGKLLTAKVFQDVYGVLAVNNLFTTTYHPQTNWQCECYNPKVLSSLRHCVADRPTDGECFAETAAYAYNSQIHISTNVSLFDLALSRCVPPLKLADPVESDPFTAKTARLR